MAVFVVCLVNAKETSAKDIYLSCGFNSNYKVTTGWFGSKFYYEEGMEWVQDKGAEITKDRVISRGWSKTQKECTPKCEYAVRINLVPFEKKVDTNKV